MNCKEVMERLPWYLNGTVEDEEAESMARHLEACDSCRRGAEATLQALGAVALEDAPADPQEVNLSEHPSSDALLEIAWCEAGCAKQEQLRHLALCSACQDAVAGARESLQLRSSRVSSAPDEAVSVPGQSSDHGTRLRNVLAAAVFLLSVLVGIQQVSIQRGQRVSAQPSTSATIVDLFSEDSMERSQAASEDGEPTLSSDVPILLLLHPSRSVGPFEVKLLDAHGETLFEATLVELLPTGDITLSLPPAFLEEGSYSAVLRPVAGESTGEVFRFAIESPMRTNGAQS